MDVTWGTVLVVTLILPDTHLFISRIERFGAATVAIVLP